MKSNKNIRTVLLLTTVVTSLCAIIHFHSKYCIVGYHFPDIKLDIRSVVSNKDVNFILELLVQQRNNFSRALNLYKQITAQIECKMKNKVASTGGWCAETSVENSGEHQTDIKLAEVLAEFFKGKYVASFGDGPGRYKHLLLNTGLLKGYDAFDGAPFSENTSEGRVQYLDLTLPQYGLPLYDWILSLEVAEHIPEEYEDTFLDNIVRHAREGVVLSWAKPGQGGFSHVNTRSFEYVKDSMEKLGFVHDIEASERLKKSASLAWLQWNTNVYRRKDSGEIEHIKSLIT